MAFGCMPRALNALRAVFIGPNGWRAGWRLLLFGLIATVLSLALVVAMVLVRWPRTELAMSMAGEALAMLALLAAAWVMGRLERRSLADYGLAWNMGAVRRFARGVAAGFLALSILVGLLAAIGALRFTGVNLAGAARWAAIYAALFLLVGLFEEFLFRGYVLYTLTTGIGFWPSAALLTLLFGLFHIGNAGESPIGIVNAGLIGFAFCIMLRRTGDLWLPIGFHAAWDWAQSWLYGVGNSAAHVPGALLISAPAGPALVSGGGVGPEGSVLCTVVTVAVGAASAALMREAKYRPGASPPAQPA